MPSTAHPTTEAAAETDARRAALAALAAADLAALDAAWAALAPQPAWRWLRRPETGLLMVRGRAGGSGAPFNLGEVPVTRCAVALDDGPAGFGWVMGRVPRKAWLVAVFDALWQRPERRAEVEAAVIAPARVARADADRTRRAETAATRVDFFTLVRGEDEETAP